MGRRKASLLPFCCRYCPKYKVKNNKVRRGPAGCRTGASPTKARRPGQRAARKFVAKVVEIALAYILAGLVLHNGPAVLEGFEKLVIQLAR